MKYANIQKDYMIFPTYMKTWEVSTEMTQQFSIMLEETKFIDMSQVDILDLILGAKQLDLLVKI